MKCGIVCLLCTSLTCVVGGSTHGFTRLHACHGAYNIESVTSAESMKAQVHASQDFRTVRHLRHWASVASPEMLSLLDPKCSSRCATIGYDVEVLMPRVFRDFMSALGIGVCRPVHVEKQVCVQGGRDVVQTTSVSDCVLSGVRVHTKNTFPDTKTMQSVMDLHVDIPWYAAVLRAKILEHLKQTLVRADNELSVSLCVGRGSGCRQEMPVALPMLCAANLSAVARDTRTLLVHESLRV